MLTRDIGYATAAVATTVERYERGLQVAGKIDDKTLREGVRSWLIYRAVLHFIAAGDLDDAHRLNLNDDPILRAICYVVGAQRLVENNDTIRAGGTVRHSDSTRLVVVCGEVDEKVRTGVSQRRSGAGTKTH